MIVTVGCDFWLWLLVVTFGCDFWLWLLVVTFGWNQGLGLGILDWDWGLGLGMGIGIRDYYWDWELGFQIKEYIAQTQSNFTSGLLYRCWDIIIAFMQKMKFILFTPNKVTALITLFRWLCGCWITENYKKNSQTSFLHCQMGVEIS